MFTIYLPGTVHTPISFNLFTYYVIESSEMSWDEHYCSRFTHLREKETQALSEVICSEPHSQKVVGLGCASRFSNLTVLAYIYNSKLPLPVWFYPVFGVLDGAIAKKKKKKCHYSRETEYRMTWWSLSFKPLHSPNTRAFLSPYFMPALCPFPPILLL